MKTSKRYTWKLLKRFKFLIKIILVFSLICCLLLVFFNFRNDHPLETLKHNLILIAKKKKDLLTSITKRSLYNKDRRKLRVELFIAPQFLEKIEKKKQEALKLGILITEASDEVSAKIIFNKKLLDAKLRLKGDWTDHLKKNKESFRIKIKKGKFLNGMRKLSIQDDSTRGGFGEYFLYHLLQRQDILTPRFFRSDVYLNNQYRGLLVVEEHFTKEMLESQSRRESPIFAYDESPIWLQRAKNRETNTALFIDSKSVNDTHTRLYFKAFQKSKFEKNQKLLNLYKHGLARLRGYSEGFLSFSQVFDQEKHGALLAFLNLFNAGHGLIDHNLRFYFNPVSFRFEPIAFDNYVDFNNLDGPVRFNRATLHSPTKRLLTSYIQTLKLFESDLESGNIKNFLKNFSKKYFYDEKQLLEEFPFRKLKLRSQQLRKLAKNIDPKDTLLDQVQIPKIRHNAQLINYLNTFHNNQHLELENNTDRPLKVTKITDKSQHPLFSKQMPLIVPVKNSYKKNVLLQLPENHRENYFVYAEAKGLPSLQHKSITYTSPLKLSMKESLNKKLFLQTFPFVKFKNNQFIIPPGFQKIHSDFIVPENYDLKVKAGAQFAFAADRRFVHRGAAHFEGNSSAPIIFKSLSEEKPWRGIVLLGNSKKIKIEHLTIHGVNRKEDLEWPLTGALTIHNGDIYIDNLNMNHNESEDSLNIISSSMDLKNIKIENTISDAIDIDFGTGSMKNVFIENCKGDGIDISATSLMVSDSSLKNIHDKALSIGERSNFRGFKVHIEQAGAALISKDGSKAQLENSQIQGIKDTVYMTYIKKPEYSAPTLIVKNNQVSDFKTLYQAEAGSFMKIDGRETHYQNMNVKKMYQTGRMKKK